MKRILLYLSVVFICFSCEDDKEVFDTTIPSENIVFESIYGGAIMKYDLSKSSTDVYYIKAEYIDITGKTNIVKGTYLSKEVKLMGFVEEQKGVPVKISLLDQNNVESKHLNLTFDTKESVACSVAKNAKVHPYWSGFYVDYEAKENGGFIHVAKVGLDPFTKVVDTLLLATKPIEASMDDKKNKILFADVCNAETNLTDVVIWTEDLRGNTINKKSFPKIQAVIADLIDPVAFDFVGSSLENEENKIGWKYLFDGDTKGYQHTLNGGDEYYRFRSMKNALPANNKWIVDLKEAKNLAKIRLYSGLRSGANFNQTLFNTHPEEMVPCHVKIYGANNIVTKMNGPYEEIDWDATEKVQLAEHQEKSFSPATEKWHYPFCVRLKDNMDAVGIEKADPCFLQLKFEISEDTYRYVVLEVLENSCATSLDGIHIMDHAPEDGIVTLQELEIYEKR